MRTGKNALIMLTSAALMSTNVFISDGHANWNEGNRKGERMNKFLCQVEMMGAKEGN